MLDSFCEMNYAVAIWNYCWNPAGIEDWILEFADGGFDTISLNPGQFTGCSVADVSRVGGILQRRGLGATVHGTCAMGEENMKLMIAGLGDTLRVFTMDPSKGEDSRGLLHNASKAAAALACVQDLTAGTDVLLGIEDFPLDALAVEQFADELGDVYRHPRTGILVDVGHMHLRRTGAEYFRSMSVEDYFARLPYRIVEIHVHDNSGSRDEHGHLGMGTVPFADVAQGLRKTGFAGVSTIEIAPGFHGSTADESKPRAFESLWTWRSLLECQA